MSIESNLKGPFAASSGESDGAPPDWPVLARLPLVGPRSIASSERLPTYAAMETATTAAIDASPPLRVVDSLPDDAPIDSRAMPYGVRIDPPQHRGRGSLVEPSPATPSSRRELYRIDSAEDRYRGLHSAHWASDDSAAVRLAQWHAWLAPYAGVAVTAALILAASLLYWLTVGGPQLAIDDGEMVDMQNSWSSETPIGPPVSAVTQPLEGHDDLFAAAPAGEDLGRVADAAAPVHETPAAVEDHDEAEAPQEAAPPAPVEPMSPIAAAPITPTPIQSPYPTTSYAWFEFGLPTTSPAAPPVTASSAAANLAAPEERSQ